MSTTKRKKKEEVRLGCIGGPADGKLMWLREPAEAFVAVTGGMYVRVSIAAIRAWRNEKPSALDRLCADQLLWIPAEEREQQ